MEAKEENKDDKEIEKKLSDLLNIGWILLNEKCPLESCDCPLLKSFDGNKYFTHFKFCPSPANA